jgi:hypothetical protein
MELRQLITTNEREIFARCLAEARATRGFGFRETGSSRIAQAHLTFADLYAVFENEGEPPDRMKAGFTVHDLATLPQSYPKPDLSHIPPQYVIEGGELWSLSRGVGQVARLICRAVAGIKQARAILIYSILKPADLTPFYRADGYVNACEPVEWPYVESVDGGSILVQPMILEGKNLREYIHSGFECLFQTSSVGRSLHFHNPLPQRRPLDDPKAIAGDTALAALPGRSDNERQPANGVSTQPNRVMGT